MPLDPQIDAMLSSMPPWPGVRHIPLAMLRQSVRDSSIAIPPAQDAVVAGVEDRTIAGPGGDLVLRIYTPQGEGPFPVTLYMHGGGFVVGDLDTQDMIARALCAWGETLVISVDYRLAPEHPFPAALDDCFAALGWLIEHADELGVDPSRVMIGGNSAGGGLAAALAQRAHDAGLNVVFQLLVYPMLDDRTVPRAEAAGEYTLVWTPKANRYGWASYLGAEPGVGAPPPYAAPARRADLAGLPAAWIGVGSVDLFHDEDVEYARRLTDAGVDCTLYVAKGMPHGTNIGNEAPLPEAFNRAALNALAAALW